jgi:hypothetical protein
MTASRADVQAKLDAALADIKNATDELTAARAEVGDLQDPSSSPTPAPSGTSWQWDATKATVRPDSATLITSFLTYAGFPSYLAVERAVAIVAAGTQTYEVSSIGQVGAMDATIYVPIGTQPGVSSDHHLCIIDEVHGRWHDFWHATFTNGKLVSWDGGSSMPLGSINVPYITGKTHQAATAAHLPLAQGAISPEEIKAGKIDHALMFSMNKPGPQSDDSYPATHAGGYSNVGHISLGNWLRLAPSTAVPTAASPLERLIIDALKQYGMFCGDQGSTLNLHGFDLSGGGRSIAQWEAVGVTLTKPPSSTLPVTGGMNVKLPNIPWDKLQVLEPPTP